MWLWFRRRMILWGAVALGLPLLAKSLHGLADAVEARRGPSPAAARLHQAGAVTDRMQQTLSRKGKRRR
jgi:hypothetical protein